MFTTRTYSVNNRFYQQHRVPITEDDLGTLKIKIKLTFIHGKLFLKRGRGILTVASVKRDKNHWSDQCLCVSSIYKCALRSIKHYLNKTSANQNKLNKLNTYKSFCILCIVNTSSQHSYIIFIKVLFTLFKLLISTRPI